MYKTSWCIILKSLQIWEIKVILPKPKSKYLIEKIGLLISRTELHAITASNRFTSPKSFLEGTTQYSSTIIYALNLGQWSALPRSRELQVQYMIDFKNGGKLAGVFRRMWIDCLSAYDKRDRN